MIVCATDFDNGTNGARDETADIALVLHLDEPEQRLNLEEKLKCFPIYIRTGELEVIAHI